MMTHNSYPSDEISPDFRRSRHIASNSVGGTIKPKDPSDEGMPRSVSIVELVEIAGIVGVWFDSMLLGILNFFNLRRNHFNLQPLSLTNLKIKTKIFMDNDFITLVTIPPSLSLSKTWCIFVIVFIPGS